MGNSKIDEEFIEVRYDGHPFQPFRKIRIGHKVGKPVIHDLEEMNERGFASERRFEYMVRELIGEQTIPALRGIRKATRNQDVKHQTDFHLTVVLTNTQREIDIPIQVKSSTYGAYQFFKENPQTSIYVVVMNRTMTISVLVKVIRNIIKREKRRLNLQFSAPITVP